MECAEDSTGAGESLSELPSLKGKALEFLCKSGQEGRDAARSKIFYASAKQSATRWQKGQIVTVSLETVKIVKSLPALGLP